MTQDQKWKLVPVEPTPEMVEASWGKSGTASIYPDGRGLRERISIDYQAMLAAAPTPPAPAKPHGEASPWHDGPPPFPWSEEWFIAITTYGDRIVLKALPEEYTYDFKTADGTYLRKDLVACWMQFPDSEYKPAPVTPHSPPPAPVENIREGAPYDDPAFESLCREHDIWGTAQSAVCAVFWMAAKAALTPQQDAKDGVIEAILGAADEWANYVEADAAPMTLRKYLERALTAAQGGDKGE